MVASTPKHPTNLIAPVAGSNFNQLKEYYQKENNSDAVLIVNQEIQSTKYNMSYKPTQRSSANALSPATNNEINNQVNKIRALTQCSAN